MQWVSSWGCFEHDRSLRWSKLYFSKFLAVAFTGAELSVASIGIKDEDGAVFAGDLDRLTGGGAQVEQIDAQRVRSFSALVRMAEDRTPFTARQDEFSCERLEECGRMTGGWLKPGGWPKQVARAKDAKDAKVMALRMMRWHGSWWGGRLASTKNWMIKGQISDRLKPSSFRLWRRRVSGRIAKDRGLLEQKMRGLDWREDDDD